MIATDEAMRRKLALDLLRSASDSIVRWPGWTLVILGALLVYMVLGKL